MKASLTVAVILTALSVSCNKGDSSVDKITPTESTEFVATNADPTAITQGTGVPKTYLVQDELVKQAEIAYVATLTPEKVAALAFGADPASLSTDIQAFMSQWLKSKQPLVEAAHGRVATSPAPSPMVIKVQAYTDSKLDAIVAQVDADKITDDQAKALTVKTLAENYNMIYSMPNITEAERNSLLASHRSGFNHMNPAEDILKKLQPANANGRVGYGWFKRLRKMVLKVIHELIKATVQSFASGCYNSGSASGCVQGGLNQAQGDLGKNAQNSINTAITTVK